jgi:GNAT superfamily N-acetyltransferase
MTPTEGTAPMTATTPTTPDRTRTEPHDDPKEAAEPASTKATPGDLPVLAAALAAAFQEDPVCRWVLPDERRRPARLKRTFALALRHIYLRHRETYTTGGREGAALWLPPGRWKLSGREQIGFLLRMARPTEGSSVGSMLRFVRMSVRAEQLHPPRPHYYLGVLGVEPLHRGRGIGSALLSSQLERCDREGMPAYLEASSERNRDLYLRHGFAVTDEVRLPAGGPPVWLMWRQPER